MRLNNLKSIILILIVVLFCINAKAQLSIESKIDSILLNKYKTKEPGAVVLISKNGEVVYQKAFGSVNLELDVPMNTKHVFNIGSMTKQFTAMSVLMLFEQGKLNIDDEITKYLPEYPTNGRSITIHHLLNHTSGIKSYTSLQKVRKMIRTDFSPKELIDVFKNEPFDFNPGEAFKYNNSGYAILGYIIELISGQSFGEFVEKNIFQELEMTSSFYGSHSKIIQNRASGYHSRNGQFKNVMYASYSLPFSSGSLMSNTEDLLKWQQAIKNNTLIKNETSEKMFTNYTLNDGSPSNYGYGWHIRKIDKVKTYEHGGSIFGFKSMAVYIPSEDIYVAILTNCDCNSPTKTTKDIAELVLKEFNNNP